MTPFTAFYEPLRLLLGDRQSNGAWNYEDATLASALRTVFATGRQPAAYRLVDDAGVAVTPANLGDATQVSPAVALGGDFARIAHVTAKALILGEDGQISVNTRSVSVRDGGERKRDLLIHLELAIRDDQIDDLFDTVQRFAQWCAARVQPADYPSVNVVTPPKYGFTV